MKRIGILFLILFSCLLSQAADDSRAQQAEELYAAEKYQEAADLYNAILSEGFESAALYYNLGNCYYKLGENTKAIVSFERALLLDPGDSMIRYNLEMAQQKIVDKIEVLPEMFLVRWFKALETSCSADVWGIVSVVLFVLFLVMLALFFYSSVILVKKIGFTVGVIAFLLAISSFVLAERQNSRLTDRKYAVITAPSVTIKGAPDESGTSLFLIHEGLKVEIMEQLGDWYNIRLSDGNEGWIAKSDIERI